MTSPSSAKGLRSRKAGGSGGSAAGAGTATLASSLSSSENPKLRPIAPLLDDPSITEPTIHEFTMPMAKPDYTPLSTNPNRPKTLIEIAAEREEELRKQMDEREAELRASGKSLPKPRTAKVQRNSLFGKEYDEYGDGSGEDDDGFTPLGNAILYTFSLTALHFMLDVLVYSQYGMAVSEGFGDTTSDPTSFKSRPSAPSPTKEWWAQMAARSLKTIPAIFLLTYLMHTPTSKKQSLRLVRQLFFFIIAVGTGMTLIWSGNKMAYYAVMKRAPPLGTLWIWSVVELEPVPAGASVLLVGMWALWNGLGLF